MDLFYPAGYSNFSFATEPLGDHHSGPTWIPTEGQQNFQIPASQSSTASGVTDSYDFIPMSRMSQGGATAGIDTHSLSIDVQNSWAAQNTNVEMLERYLSQNSHDTVPSPPRSVRTVISEHPDKAQSVELRPSFSQVSFPTSSGHSDITDQSFSLPDNSAIYPSSPDYMDSQVYSELTYVDEMNPALRRASFHSGAASGNTRRSSQLLPLATGSSFPTIATSPEEVMFTTPMDLTSQPFFEHTIAQDGLHPSLDPLEISESSWVWETSIDEVESGASTPFSADVSWAPSTAAKSPMEYSQSPAVRSPRINRNSMPQQNGSVLGNTTATCQRRSSINSGVYESEPKPDSSHSHGSSEHENSPRDHPLYQRAAARPDGLYHCPWEGEPSCNHKPEKLKCNYDKFVDSHLKPYRCKIHACESARFSSTACLLRHEREAHAMHGHGEKPYLCTFGGCDRGIPGNGFPRHWNLCDHMKRVHNRSPSPGGAKPPRVSRKRKNDSSDTGPSKKALATASSTEKLRPPAQSLSLNEQFQNTRQQLLSDLQDMPDLVDIDATLQKLNNAKNKIQMMANATQQLKSAPKLERKMSLQSG